MNRRERRAAEKSRLKLLKGGKADVPDVPNTPAARLARKLDAFVRSCAQTDKSLQQQEILAVLLQMTAALTAEMGVDTYDVTRALEHFVEQERKARKK